MDHNPAADLPGHLFQNSASIRDAAKQIFHANDELVINDDAPVHDNREDGFWVQAWLYVPYQHFDEEP